MRGGCVCVCVCVHTCTKKEGWYQQKEDDNSLCSHSYPPLAYWGQSSLTFWVGREYINFGGSPGWNGREPEVTSNNLLTSRFQTPYFSLLSSPSSDHLPSLPFSLLSLHFSPPLIPFSLLSLLPSRELHTALADEQVTLARASEKLRGQQQALRRKRTTLQQEWNGHLKTGRKRHVIQYSLITHER